MAATSKAELLNITQKEFGKLAKLIDTIDADTAMEKRDEGTSIHERQQSESSIATINRSVDGCFGPFWSLRGTETERMRCSV